MKKVIVVGGHLTPALAVVEALETRKDYKIIFFGRKKATDGSDNLSAEYQEVIKKGIEFVNIITGRLTRKITKYTIPSLVKIPLGFLLAFFYLIKYRPNIIVSFGGYLSTPVVFAGWLLGIESVVHEQASVPGLANKINSLFTKKVFLSWEQTKEYFPKEKSAVIGTPQSKSLRKKAANDKKIQSFISKKDMIAILGGSQGSHVINNFIFRNIDLLKNYSVLHQLGTANYGGDHAKAANIKKGSYLAVDYISPEDIGAVMSAAKFIISRSGANTVWDLATLAKPAILIPLAIAAGDEQTKNAQVLETAGCAIVVSQKDLSRQRLKDAIGKMEGSLSEFEKNAKTFQKTLPKSPTAKLVQYISSIV